MGRRVGMYSDLSKAELRKAMRRDRRSALKSKMKKFFADNWRSLVPILISACALLVSVLTFLFAFVFK